MKKPQETPLAQSLPAAVPFVGPEAIERRRGRAFAARLGANESSFGPSPQVLETIAKSASDAWMYGDPEGTELRAALADHLGCAPDQVVVGEGIDGLLGYVVRLFVTAGDKVVTSDGAYPTFNYHVAGFGGDLIKVPYRDDHEDLDGLLAAARAADARMIYLANPDNPMGSWHKASAIEAMIGDLPDNCLLLLDEAYVEFAPADAVPRIALEDPRVIRMRTFSKAHGLAGMRIGYAFGAAELIRSFDKIRNHFGLGRLAQATALAALADRAWLEEIRVKVAAARDRIAAIARDNGLNPLPSATNFVTIDCGRDGDFARAVLTALEERDIFVRMPFAAPGNRCIRISAGSETDLDRLAGALPGALEAAKSAQSGALTKS